MQLAQLFGFIEIVGSYGTKIAEAVAPVSFTASANVGEDGTVEVSAAGLLGVGTTDNICA